MADEEVQEQEPQQEAQQEEGLLDSAQIAEPEVETPVEEPSHQEPTEDGKPDWLPDRFWNDENGADYEALAKSQDELYKKLRGGKHQAPEDGNYDLKFLNESIPEDDELLANFKKIAADRGLTQDDFESIVGLVKDNMPSEDQAAEEKFDREQELAKLGPNGEDVVNGHVKWAQSLVERGAWTSDDFEEFKFSALEVNELFWQSNQPGDNIPWRKVSTTQGKNLKAQSDHNFNPNTVVWQKT